MSSRHPSFSEGPGPYPTDDATDLTVFLRRLPKAELHLHLEGTVTPQTLVDLSERHVSGNAAASADGERPLTIDAAHELYHYTDFTGFIMCFKAITAQLKTPEDYELITYRMARKLAEQGVVHAEVYVSIGVIFYWRREEAASNPLLIDQTFAGMERGRLRAEKEFGITLYWIFDAVRHFGVEEAVPVFRKAAELGRTHPSLIGIGIGGDERITGAEPFKELYAEARANGLRLTCHAGENAGPESIWAALNIGAERIGHGFTAQFDNELMELLAQRQVPIEICMTSNVRTASCRSMDLHPVRRYFEAGLMVTLNSDDPALFGSDLEGEYILAHEVFEFTREHLRELAANSIEASFLPPEAKVAWLQKIAAYEADDESHA